MRYSFESEVALRDNIYSLETPWYRKAKYTLIAAASLIVIMTTIALLIKCGILGIFTEYCINSLIVVTCKTRRVTYNKGLYSEMDKLCNEISTNDKLNKDYKELNIDKNMIGSHTYYNIKNKQKEPYT